MLQKRINEFSSQPFWQKVGVSLSFICAVHCVISPIFIALLPVVSSTVFHNPAIEIILLGSSFLIVGVTNLIGFIEHHKKYAPIAIMLLGFSLIISGHLTDNYLIEIFSSVLGGIFIGFSILFNSRAKHEVAQKDPCCKH